MMKIVTDWANNNFKNFDLALLVSLKLLKPCDTIETVILRQNYNMNKLHECSRKVLEDFGSRCLVILDGEDENDVMKNDDLKNIIMNKSFEECNFI